MYACKFVCAYAYVFVADGKGIIFIMGLTIATTTTLARIIITTKIRTNSNKQLNLK